MIVNYYEPGVNFELPPEKAIEYFVGKGLKPTWNWYEMLNAEHDVAFTVAKMMDTDLLATVRAELDKAISQGLTLADFKKNLVPTLQAKGWWGKKDIIDPATGMVQTIQLGSASRLETIFRTNMQSAYAAGHWQAIMDGANEMPYLLYDAVDDSKTRAEHAQMDGTVLPVDHQFWQTNYPPNGWNCRCGVIQLSAEDLEDYGLSVSKGKFNQTKKWTNPSTGELFKIPFGTDPGFAHNPGMALYEKIKAKQAEKIAKLPPDAAIAAKKGVKATEGKAKTKKKAQKAIEAVGAADATIAAKAIEHAKTELDLIAQGKAQKQAKLKQKALEQAEKSGLSKDLTPVELLEHVVMKAAAEQAKKEKASAIAGYKKKVLEGKLPTKKQQEVFDSLTDAEKAKVIGDIDKQKAKLAEQTAKPTKKKTQAAKVALDVSELDMANMKQIGGQGGSNPGGLYYDETTGKKWYIKQPKSDDHARNEVLAAKLYDAAGIEVPNVVLMRGPDGNLRIASEIIDGIEQDGDLLASGKVANVYDGFAVDAWLANWDVVGLGYDNMVILKNRAIRLDTGGALLFRAQGSPKGSAFGSKVTELETLRDAKTNPQSARVFAKMTNEDIEKSAARLERISDEDIDVMVSRYGPGNAKARAELAATLKARKAYILKQFTKAKETKKAALEAAEKRLQEQVKQKLKELDDQMVMTIKGIAAHLATQGVRDVDIQRFSDLKAMYDQLLKSGKLDRTTKRKVTQHYESWIKEIKDALYKQDPLSGRFFTGYDGPIRISRDAIEELAERLGDLPPTSLDEATRIIQEYLGNNAANMTVPVNGARSLQGAYEKLTEAHKRAIAAYTGSHYRDLNERLYTRTATPEVVAFRNLLNEALEYSDDYEGFSGRGMSLSGSKLKKWIEGHQRAAKEGKPIRYLSFTSSTRGKKGAFDGNIKIVIQGKTGTWVNPISLHAGREDEVLFRAGTTFMVDKVVDQGGDRYTVHLTEIENTYVETDLEFNEWLR